MRRDVLTASRRPLGARWAHVSMKYLKGAGERAPEPFLVLLFPIVPPPAGLLSPVLQVVSIWTPSALQRQKMVLEETAVSHRGGSIKIEKTPRASPPIFLKFIFIFTLSYLTTCVRWECLK